MSNSPDKNFTITVLEINRRQVRLLTSLTSEVSPGDILLLADNHNHISATTEVESVCRFDRDTLTPSINGNAQEILVNILSGSAKLTLSTAIISNTEVESAKINNPEDGVIDLPTFESTQESDLSLGLDLGLGHIFTDDQDDEVEAMEMGGAIFQPEARPDEFIARPVQEDTQEESIAERLSRVSQEMFGTAEDSLIDSSTDSSAEAHFDSYIGDLAEEERKEESPDLQVNLSQPAETQSEEDAAGKLHEPELPLTLQEAEFAEQAEALMPEEPAEEDDDFFDFDIDINLDQKLSDGPVYSNPVEILPEITDPVSQATEPVLTQEDPPVFQSQRENRPSQNLLDSPESSHSAYEELPLQPAEQIVSQSEAVQVNDPVEVVQPERPKSSASGGGFMSGDRIFTQEHGEGTVQKVFPFEDSYNLTVLFDNAGKKILNTKYSTIKKL